MKKKVLLLMASALLMLAMVPAAFAADNEPDTITRPDGVEVPIPTVTLAENNDMQILANNEIRGSGTKEQPYLVNSEDELFTLAQNKFTTSTVKYSYVKIENDITLTSKTAPAEWGAYFNYFYGEIYGATVTDEITNEQRPAKITGLPTNCFLINYWCGGSIHDLTIDPNGQAGCLTFVPARFSDGYRSFTMKNVNMVSDKPVTLEQGDNQANYALYVYAGAGEFNMTDCTSNVDITGTSYGSVFHGYYPMDPTGHYTFTNCVNKGDVTMRHAAMFFGNNSAFTDMAPDAYKFNTDTTKNRIQFVNCKNEGHIYGTQTANIFATRAASNGGNDPTSDAYEQYLYESGCKPQDSVAIIGQDLGMTLTYDEQGNLSMTEATRDNVDYYVVSVASYVGRYIKTGDNTYISDGSDRISVKQTLKNPTDSITLKYYGLCDYPIGTEGLSSDGTIIDGYPIVSYNSKKYYWIDSSEKHFDGVTTAYHFVNRPLEPSSKAEPDLVTLTAYSSTNTILGSVSAQPRTEGV